MSARVYVFPYARRLGAIRRTARGLHTGLVVTITEKVAPFYEEAKGLARWLAETPIAAFRPFEAVYDPTKDRVTLLTPKNQAQQYPSPQARFAAREAAGKKWRRPPPAPA